jgi:hypothetical protein
VFINTYDMKVTASAPAWAWGDWYQSDAYSIGEHDRTQLEFSTGLLATQPHRPVMIGEFQAGWLQGADQSVPRPADPTNTTLALHTLLQMGAHGIVNFPVQDTLYPAGWEAPWANAFYSWDAALALQLSPQARWAPTARFGQPIARYGTQLAQTHRAADAAIAYLTSAYDPARLSNDQIAQVAQATMDAQRGCRLMRITCALVDLRYISPRDLQHYPVLILPPSGVTSAYVASVQRLLATYRSRGGRTISRARAARIALPAAGGIPNAVLLVSADRRFAFLDIVNYGWRPLRTRGARVHDGAFSADVPAQVVPARDAMLIPLGIASTTPWPGSAPLAGARGGSIPHHDSIPLRRGSWITSSLRDTSRAPVYVSDVYDDGYPAVVFENEALRLIVSPCAGARAFVLEDKARGDNLFTTVGGMRDAWLQQLEPSSRDYIGKYTHPIATGTFNRCYTYRINAANRSATFAYSAPDAPAHGALFRKTVSLDAESGSASTGFSVTLVAQFPRSSSQRAQELTSVAIDRETRIVQGAGGVDFVETSQHRTLAITWKPGAIEHADVQRHDVDALVTLTFAPGAEHTTRYLVRRDP